MYQKLIDMLIRAHAVPVSTIEEPCAPTLEDLTALRVHEMVISPLLQNRGRRERMPEFSDEAFLGTLSSELQGQFERLVANYDESGLENWCVCDSLLKASGAYWRASETSGSEESGEWWLRLAVIEHLRALGYQEPLAKRIVASTSTRLVIAAVRWARDAFRYELAANPQNVLHGTATQKETLRAIKTAFFCMLRGLVEEGEENHLSHKIIRNTLKTRGYQLPRADMRNRETVLGFLEAARLSLMNIPGTSSSKSLQKQVRPRPST